MVLCTLLVACGGDLGTSTPEPAPPAYLAADGVKVTRLSLYQGLERDLMSDGAVGSLGANIPTIAGRDALLRVYYATDAAYDGGIVLARVTLTDTPPVEAGSGGGMPTGDAQPIEKTIEVTGTLWVASSHDDLGSTLNVDIPGALLTPTSSFRVDILRARAQSTGTNAQAAYPTVGSQSFQAVSSGSKVRIVLVPVRYNSDGSGRLPDTSPEQVNIYRDVFLKMYPTPDIEIRVAEPFDWKGIAIQGSGQGWGELLNAVSGHRQASKAAFDEYYYGLFRAQETFEAFCGGSCIAGLSQLAPSPFNDTARVGIGIGFSGEGMAQTAIHEIGHEHGRGHVPCGTNQGLDPGYPHDGGSIGGWGYDRVTKQLVKPETKDFMSYCDPKWVSDFTYSALFTRIQAVNVASMNWVVAPGTKATARYERIAILPNGKLDWLEPFELERPPVGEAETIHLEGPTGQADVVGQFFPYSHLPGGVMFFPAAGRVDRVRLRNYSVSH